MACKVHLFHGRILFNEHTTMQGYVFTLNLLK